MKTLAHKKALDILIDCYKRKGVVFTMGCGGSASTASHFAADLAKTVGGFKTISLVDNTPLVSAITNDLGWDRVFDFQLDSWLTKNDVLVGFSVHGGSDDWSQNLVRAMKLAKERKAKIIGFTGRSGGKMKEMADACLTAPGDTWDTVEGVHSVLAHDVIFDLKERLK
jgi:D-sedoheptulose 7-phosphate isomerase